LKIDVLILGVFTAPVKGLETKRGMSPTTVTHPPFVGMLPNRLIVIESGFRCRGPTHHPLDQIIHMKLVSVPELHDILPRKRLNPVAKMRVQKTGPASNQNAFA
jgi:hypothetical protein